jgi:hypothetical protein
METDYINEDDPYGLEIEALDSLKPGDVVVHSRFRGNDHGLGRPCLLSDATTHGRVLS